MGVHCTNWNCHIMLSQSVLLAPCNYHKYAVNCGSWQCMLKWASIFKTPSHDTLYHHVNQSCNHHRMEEHSPLCTAVWVPWLINCTHAAQPLTCTATSLQHMLHAAASTSMLQLICCNIHPMAVQTPTTVATTASTGSELHSAPMQALSIPSPPGPPCPHPVANCGGGWGAQNCGADILVFRFWSLTWDAVSTPVNTI